MRGKIIHYNGSDGRGLIAADDRQVPFEIAQWRSDTAPGVNQVVEVSLADGALEAVFRVPDETILKEKASQFASKLGTAGGVAMQTLREATPPDAAASAATGWRSLGKPLLIAYGVFAVSALLLPYISVDPVGLGGRSFTLMELPEATEGMGTAVGSEALTWLAILSIALPVLWRSRFAWFALLLPLYAALQPGIDLMRASMKASEYSSSDSFEAKLQRQIFEQVMDMLEVGIGVWVCVAAALVIAAIGLKRVLLPPAR